LERFVASETERRRQVVAQAARPGLEHAEPLQPSVAWMPYGPDAAKACVEVAAEVGSPAVEYAAVRRGAAVMDGVHRGTIEVRGADRAAFLQRMLTQDMKGLEPGGVRESFWLNRKGRVQADLLLGEFGDRMLVDVDRFVAPITVQELQGFLFSEDVSLQDATANWGRLAVHGAAAIGLLAACGADPSGLSADLRCTRAAVSGVETWLVRRDQCGVPGVELFVATADLERVFDALLSADGDTVPRPLGWHAFNVARIEAGTPLFLVDFGREALPHETGLLARRVNFRKGCYLGQEVVARMESLGKPKQRLVGLRMQDERLPVAGAQVHQAAAAGEAVGTITSSAPAPMLGSASVAFAMVRHAMGEPGTRLRVAAEGDWSEAEVQAGLRFLTGAA